MKPLRFISTDTALRFKEKFGAISYVWEQCRDINKLKTEIKEILMVAKEDCGIWLDQISNRNEENVNDEYGIKNMNKIYMNASFTIAIIPELHNSIVDSKDMEKRISDKYKNNKNENKDLKYNIYDMADLDYVHVIANSQWFTRAWTFQEQILSRRIITMIRGKIYNIKEIVDSLLVIQVNRGKINDLNNKLRAGMSWYTVDDDYNVNHIGYHEYGNINMLIDKRTKDFNNIRNNIYNACCKSELTLIKAMSLIGNRLMGSENKGYEPIRSILNEKIILVDKFKDPNIFHLNTIISNEVRSEQNGLCWVPKRLRTTNDLRVYDGFFGIII